MVNINELRGHSNGEKMHTSYELLSGNSDWRKCMAHIIFKDDILNAWFIKIVSGHSNWKNACFI